MFGLNNTLKNETIAQSSIKLLKFTIKVAVENNLKFVFIPKYLENQTKMNSDINFYEMHLNKEELKFLISNTKTKKNHYSSYLMLFQSTLAVGMQSTLLFDKIGCKEKILSCNFSTFEPYN